MVFVKVLLPRAHLGGMSMTTIQSDVSQSIFEFLHSELVAYLQERQLKMDKVQRDMELSSCIISMYLSTWLV